VDIKKKRIGTIVTLSRKLYASLRVIKRSLHRKQHAAVLALYRLSLPSFTTPRIWVANIMDYVKMINERTVFLAKDRPSCCDTIWPYIEFTSAFEVRLLARTKDFPIYETSTRAPKLARPSTYQVTALFLGGG
jgi:hypothetical protein